MRMRRTLTLIWTIAAIVVGTLVLEGTIPSFWLIVPPIVGSFLVGFALAVFYQGYDAEA